MVGGGLGLGFKFLGHNGPRAGPFAFNGNGATVVPCCAGPLVLILGVVVLAGRRAYLATVLYATALIVAVVLSSRPS